MLGFFLKKSFFDGWDHLFAILLLNVGFLLSASIGVFVPAWLGAPGWLGFCLAALAMGVGAVWWSACHFALRRVADFGSLSFSDIPAALKEGLVPGLQVAAFLLLGYAVLTVGLPFYLRVGGVLGALAAGVIFWFSVVVVLALQYYLPLRARLGGGLRKNLRKSFVLFFDNPGFSVFLLIYSALNLALSLLLAFLLPGFAGVALAGNVALRLRMYKYDWLEANPGADRRKVPWDELLKEDRDYVGKRTIKGMFFPWKE